MSKAVKLLKSITEFQYLKQVKKVSNKEIGIFLKNKLVSLGPLYVKIGQFLSTRSDIIEKDIIDELKTLQDNVYPIDYDDFTYKINENIIEIDKTPIASASIGQVHTGFIKNTGEKVVLKMKRPNIKEEIDVDFKIILFYIRFIELFSTDRKIKEFELLFSEYYKVLQEEVNFKHELQNVLRFKHMFKDTKWIKIPEVYIEYSDNDVLILEYVESTKINRKALKNRNISPIKVSKKLVQSYIEQIIDHGFVHLDPHGGNIGITNDNKIVFYDFGMTFAIDDNLQQLFKNLLIAVYNKNIDDISDTLIKMELIIIEESDIPYFKLFLISLLNYIENSDLNQFKLEYIDKLNVYSTPFIISSKFILFLRGLSILEGVCKELDEDFNFKTSIEPYFNDLMFNIDYIETKAKTDINNFLTIQKDNKINDVKLEVIQSNIKNIETKLTKDNYNYYIFILGYFAVSIMEMKFDLGFISSLLLGLYVLYKKKKS
jgi:predicted unusual protein kinase regulating ubiquinone biosynthesis (AarF/ABC1/UbiB family)